MANKRWPGYALYGLAVTVFFLYWLFPAGVLQGCLESAAADRFRVKLAVHASSLTLPPGIRFATCEMTLPGPSNVVILMQDVTVRPVLRDLVVGRLSFQLRGRGYGGRVEGKLFFTKRFSSSGPMTLHGTADGIELGRMPWVEAFLGRRIEGTFTGSVHVTGASSVADTNGTISLSMEDGRYHLAEQFLGMTAVEYDRIEMRAVLESGTLSIDSINLAGKELNGSLNGTVHLNPILQRSRVALRGSVSMPNFSGPISLTFGGTLAHPLVRVGRS